MASVTFFGASVTQQKPGYVHHLCEKLKPRRSSVVAYGGCHLPDAGTCCLGEVVATCPDLCFVDWFSTGNTACTAQTSDCIDRIVWTLTRVKCRVVFLILPNKSHADRLQYYAFCKSHLDKRGVDCIDISETVKYSPKVIRDTVHTTPHGSRLYADIIYGAFTRLNARPPVLGEMWFPDTRSLIVGKKFKRCVILEGEFDKVAGIELKVGPSSGLVTVNGRRLTTWDRWCHYERTSFKFANVTPCKGRITIQVLSEKFDTAACKLPFDFTGIEKTLHISKIFYFGRSLTCSGS